MEVEYKLTLKIIDPEVLLKKTSGDQPLTPIKNILEGEIKRLSPEMCETTGDIYLLADKVSMDIKEALLEYGLEQKELIVKPKEEEQIAQQQTPVNPNDPYSQMLTPYDVPAHDPVLDLKIGEDLIQKLKEEIGPFDQSKTPNYYNNRGALFAEEGRKEEAIKEFKKVIIMRPQYAVPFINLYNLYRRAERWDEAFFYLEGALKRKYKEGEDFTYVMAMGMIESNQTDLAIRMFQLGTKYYPHSYRLYVNLGTALASQKKYADAIESYLKALVIKPDSITAMNNIAYGYYILGNYRLAVKYWERSLAINPDQPDLKQFILNVQQELKQGKK
jgi:tetratricopeptide (TPR) repeat protein